MPNWMARTLVPLFVSRRRLAKYKRRLPVAKCEWACDSGGFSELAMFGRFQISSNDYAVEVRRYRNEIGNMLWAAPQDWMCEPFMLAKTGKTVTEHQALTVGNFLDLMAAAPNVPWIPVLQGWTFGDYMRHVEMYAVAGINLAARPLVGLGSVCRRQHTLMVEELIITLANQGIKLHGFGFKIEGLRRVAGYLESADSMAWSFQGRRRYPCPHSDTRANCANCFPCAMEWREEVMRSIDQPSQSTIDFELQTAVAQ